MALRRGSRSIEHIGSAHDKVELAALKTAGPSGCPRGSSRHVADHLLANESSLERSVCCLRVLVLNRQLRATTCFATGAGQAHRADQQGRRVSVLTEAGVDAASYATVKRRLTDLCPTRVAAIVGRGVRTARGTGSGAAGPFDVSTPVSSRPSPRRPPTRRPQPTARSITDGAH